MTSAMTICHNARCGTLRTTLAAIREAGHAPMTIDYLVNPPTRDTLARLVAEAGITVRDAIHRKEAVFAELGLDQAGVDDDALLNAMVAQPILIERAFVVTPKGVRLCRPFTRVHEIL